MNKKTKGLISIMIPVIVWGISFVNTAYLLDYLGPMTIGAVRFIAATILLYAVMKLTKQPLKIDKKDKPLFVIAGAVGIALYFYFENTGIQYIDAGPSSLIIAAIPVFSLILEATVFKRKIDFVDFIVVTLSVVGVAFIIGLDLETLIQSGKAIGYWMMLGAAFAWVIYSLVSKPLFNKYSYLTIVYYQFYYSLPFLIPFIFIEHNQWHALNPTAWGHMIFLSIFASAAGFYYYAQAMDLLGVTESSVFINFLPIVTVVFAYLYTGEMIDQHQLIGGCIVISSVTASTLRHKEVQTHEASDVISEKIIS